VIGLGLVVRLVVVHLTSGDVFDLGSMVLVHDRLQVDPLHVYSGVIEAVGGVGPPRWPYPPGFFPLIAAAGSAASRLGIGFEELLRIPGVLADAGIAWLVQGYLAGQGYGPRARVAAAALVALAPAFGIISADHGQIDAVAILPAVGALLVWERAAPDRRALAAGLLIGLGAALKTTPVFVVLALLPWARSRREAGTLVAASLLVPLAALAPFLLADGHGVLRALGYHGAPGFGGISLFVQPDLASGWLGTEVVRLTDASRTVSDAAPGILALTLAALGVLLWRVRPPVAVGASLVYLAVYVSGVDFFLNYLVWGLPFFLMAGWLWPVALLEVAWLIPLGVRYLRPAFGDGAWPGWVVSWVFVPTMMALWLAALVVLVRLVRQVGATAARGRGGR